MRLFLGMGFLLVALVGLNGVPAAAQDAVTPAPIATVGADRSFEGSAVVEEGDEQRFVEWLGWPTWVGSMMLGIFWAYRRTHTSLVRAAIAKLTRGGEENRLERSPYVEEETGSGGIFSGALLLALTTVFFLSQFAIYEYPSDLKFPTEAIDILAWLDIASWLSTLFAPFLIGLLSESRGVWLIPFLGYLLGMALWLGVPGEDFGDLAYDYGEIGFLIVRVVIPALLMYLAYRIGRAFRAQFV